jgi:hypothetical protein
MGSEASNTTPTIHTAGGRFRVIIDPLVGPAVDATIVRELPTLVDSMGTADPFGPTSVQVSFPGVTLLDQIGGGDLWWMVPEANIDIVWENAAGTEVWVWEGFMESINWTKSGDSLGTTWTCQGALFEADHIQAKPEFLYQPLPYEHAIGRFFEARADGRCQPMTVEWPAGWATVFNRQQSPYNNPTRPWWVPSNVLQGEKWTGLVTRNAGTHNGALTDYITSLLTNMKTPQGRWTLALDPGRQPVLRMVPYVPIADSSTLVIDATWPGVDLDLTADHSQTANVIYGSVTSLQGDSYSGLEVSADGATTRWEPFAFEPSVEPADPNHNMYFNPARMRREITIDFPQGVSVKDAKTIAQQHFNVVGDPGVSGTITLQGVEPYVGIPTVTLTSDPVAHNTNKIRTVTPTSTTYPWRAIHAGQKIQVRGLFGREDGLTFYVTATQGTADNIQLTVDTKSRDQFTLAEIKARTRDALVPTRQLKVAGEGGTFDPIIKDLLWPWSYADGAGVVPLQARSLWTDIPPDILTDLDFPWTALTTKRSPKHWPDSYIKIPPMSTSKADYNWSFAKRKIDADGGITIITNWRVLLSANGTISLSQFALYDENGNLVQLPFHVSLYLNNAMVLPSMMPQIPSDGSTYAWPAGQHYPFFPGAFEIKDANGRVLPSAKQTVVNAQVLTGWGNGYEMAGYWPGHQSDTSSIVTGMLVDESTWTYDFSLQNTAQKGVDAQRTPTQNMGIYNSKTKRWTANTNTVRAAVMIYCENTTGKNIYMLGRLFRDALGVATMQGG